MRGTHQRLTPKRHMAYGFLTGKPTTFDYIVIPKDRSTRRAGIWWTT